MKFHFSYFKTFFWGPTSTFYPHKVPFLTAVSFSGFEKVKVKSIPQVLKTGCQDLLPNLTSSSAVFSKRFWGVGAVQAKGGTAAENALRAIQNEKGSLFRSGNLASNLLKNVFGT